MAGTGDEDFDAGMRYNAAERDEADLDNDKKLDFVEFSNFVRGREEGDASEQELRERFNALDSDGSGKIDLAEYLQWSLKDALFRSSSRVVDLFRAWDDDRSGNVDKKEFYKAIRSLGFDVTQGDSDAVFDSLDDDRSGKLEYKELNMMLRKDLGADATKRNLKRAMTQKNYSRTAKLTAKNVNVNYVTSRSAALPETVKLSCRGGVSVQEQLAKILKEHAVKLIDVFREWDDDGNGGVDKFEFRKAIAALGYDAPKKEIDGLFKALDPDGSGFIEYHEFKEALNERKIKQNKSVGSAFGGKKKQPEDVAGTGEIDFESGMRNAAADRDAADVDDDKKLDYSEFCNFVRDREAGEIPDSELRERFDALDIDGSGKIDISEYLQWSLKDSLMRSSSRVCDLFRAWDDDRSGNVDKKEFYKAIRALGFNVEQADSDAVFDSLDEDRSGKLEYTELNMMLRKGVGAEATKRNMKRAMTQKDTGRNAKLTAKNMNANYVCAHTAALPETVKLSCRGGVSVQEQLAKILKECGAKLIDLFREWDDDGNGGVDKFEFRKAVAALGYDAPKKEVDALFNSLDPDGSGFIEYHEFKEALNERKLNAVKAKASGRVYPPRLSLEQKKAAETDLEAALKAAQELVESLPI